MTTQVVQEQAMSRDEIINKLREGDYCFGHGILDTVEGLPIGIKSESRKMLLSAYLYSNAQQAKDENQLDESEIDARFNSRPFVAIFYDEGYFFTDEFGMNIDKDMVAENGRLYEFCQSKNLPVQEFLLYESESQEERDGMRTAMRTLSRLESQLAGVQSK